MSDTGSGRPLQVEAEGSLRVLTLDRPPLNVLTIDMLRAVTSAVREVADDPAAAVLLVTGAGKAFSAGVDVADHTEDRVEEMIEVFHEALLAIHDLPIPTIAAVNGAALGGGLEVALACDVRLARAGARLGQPEIRLGVFPPFAAAVLPRLVGAGAAMDLCLSGRVVDAEEGRVLGLVQQVLPSDGFGAAARAYAQEMASLSPPVLRLTKKALRAGEGDDALRRAERIYLEEVMVLEDAREGLAAFMEKRAPVWRGR